MTRCAKKLCNTCRYFIWQEFDEIKFKEKEKRINDCFGYCYRYPTIVEKSAIDWCGEYSCLDAS